MKDDITAKAIASLILGRSKIIVVNVMADNFELCLEKVNFDVTQIAKLGNDITTAAAMFALTFIQRKSDKLKTVDDPRTGEFDPEELTKLVEEFALEQISKWKVE